MLLFDIGANRGEVADIALNKGFTKVIACEPAPRIYKRLVLDRLYNPRVVPLRLAVSDTDNQRVSFYEADEDGLSTLNKNWLTADSMPYAGKRYREISVNTITVDTLCSIYGEPDLIKIDVEGAEWSVLKGITRKYGKLTLEWTVNTLDEHQKQLKYLADLGYKEVAPQFIVHHLDEPKEWNNISTFSLKNWLNNSKAKWESGGWKVANLRPTADVGMLWVR